jgi:hypothetical protein
VSGLVPRCGWCEAARGELVAVGFVAGSSGPGWSRYACAGCVVDIGLLPLGEHPAESLGEVRYRPRTKR